MDLGTHIYQLRRARGLSQDDVAEALEVSRQSVSKWENNASVPELEKLLALSGLFGVSLDELVTGDTPPAAEPQAVPAAPPARRGRTVAGGVLLACGLLLSLLLCRTTLLYGTVWLSLAGVICLGDRDHPGLSLGWSAWCFAWLFCRVCTSCSLRLCLYPGRWPNYAPGAVLISLFLMGWLLLLTALTLRARWPEEPRTWALRRLPHGLLLLLYGLRGLFFCLDPALCWSRQLLGLPLLLSLLCLLKGSFRAAWLSFAGYLLTVLLDVLFLGLPLPADHLPSSPLYLYYAPLLYLLVDMALCGLGELPDRKAP